MVTGVLTSQGLCVMIEVVRLMKKERKREREREREREKDKIMVKIWNYGKIYRILVFSSTDDDGRRHVIDTNDEWNNRTSAQSWAYSEYLEFPQETIRDEEEIKELNRLWDECRQC